ncbi:MAG: M23 family metallopeptidase [Bacteroidota bacterium]
MPVLNREQVQLVATYLAAAKLPRQLHAELLDHLCCAIEDELRHGTSFEIAYQQVTNNWPMPSLRYLRRRTFYLTKIQPMLFRMATIVFIAGSLFALWPSTTPPSQVITTEAETMLDQEAYPPVDLGPPTGSPLAGVELEDSNSKFGMRIHPFRKIKQMHSGMDFKAKEGTPVLATAAGKVIFAGENGAYGIQVKLLHGDGYVTSYAHLLDCQVKLWDEVEKGEQIARVGNTGRSIGPHLHYEVRKDDQAIDPLALLE